ncbi:hypothetical protein N0V82_007914 [Gnomoniopsis sp. IMI 355080]|nr:hypothetical protein N0V82_007914 [Gnomoniopsis sp. IMI 355080]
MTADNISSGTARPQGSPAPVPSSSFIYQPLSTESDCTRFVQIEPTRSNEARVSCKLVDIAFGDRPRYEALSYRWGGSEECGLHNPQTILLNSAEFEVGENLYNALRYLRHQSQDRLYWIDAICIDQSNIAERNQQVRIMGQIYFRATTVIIWLGSKYTEYQKHLTPENVQNNPAPTKDDSGASSQVSTDEEETTNGSGVRSEEKQLAEVLLGDEYWNRVWIIQEIAQARVLKVSFGMWDWTWDNFIHFLTAHNLGDFGPLKLNRQLREVRDTGFPICQLFKDHHRAQCKDPKDMVYGLVGLATDVCDFPIDYTKSLIEIWTDTMEYLNGRSLLTAEDIVPMGQLIKTMLMGENCCPLDQVRRLHYEPKADSVPFIDQEYGSDRHIHNKKVFHVTGFMVGFIASTGPSTREIVANMDAVSVWQRALLNNFPSNLEDFISESRIGKRVSRRRKQGQATWYPGSTGSIIA